jgi:hypothetical protein
MGATSIKKNKEQWAERAAENPGLAAGALLA